MEGFSAAHVRNRELLSDRVEWSSDYISSVMEEFLFATRYDSARSLFANGPEGRISVAHLANEQRLYLVEKNTKLIRLTDHYISNELESKETEVVQ